MLQTLLVFSQWSPKNTKKSNKFDKNYNLGKFKIIKLLPKNMSAKFGDDPSILREKIGMMNLTDRLFFTG